MHQFSAVARYCYVSADQLLPDEDRIRALLKVLRSKPQQPWHLPVTEFWAILEAQQASASERLDLLETLRRRKIAVTEDIRRGAIYLVWTGDLHRKQQDRKSPRKQAKQQGSQ